MLGQVLHASSLSRQKRCFCCSCCYNYIITNAIRLLIFYYRLFHYHYHEYHYHYVTISVIMTVTLAAIVTMDLL